VSNTQQSDLPLSVTGRLLAAWRSWWSPYAVDAMRVPARYHLSAAFLFGCALTLVFTALGWFLHGGRLDLGRLLWWNFVTTQSVAFTIHLLFDGTTRLIGAARIDTWSRARRGLVFSVLPAVGSLLGFGIGLTLLGENPLSWLTQSPRPLLILVLISAALSLYFWSLFGDTLRIADAERAAAAERARAVQLEAAALEAQLKSLQAQIEPHFLFNTLANVTALIDEDPAKARRMLERLIDLLRASLSASRATVGTLGQELDLLRAYLDIQSIRMGARLTTRIEVPEPLRGARLAPLLVQPLVENALQHGLEPKLEGGQLSISARAHGELLMIEVADDGLGFRPGASSGVGLCNLRERLAALHGAAARMNIEECTPGTRVRLTLPLSLVPDHASAGDVRP
jgi:Histidine kinase